MNSSNDAVFCCVVELPQMMFDQALELTANESKMLRNPVAMVTPEGAGLVTVSIRSADVSR